jgi:drug/metabolite transporter (DMT)-like permease
MTSLALVAFAANSVLCRMALGDETIDPSSFTSIRLVSGVVVLALLARLNRQEEPGKKGWLGPVMLFVYAIAFSYAYVSLDTGTGALILFGAVQITMIVATLVSGTRLHALEWSGVVIAFGGLVYLNLPGAEAPSAIGFALMSVAGIAWGLYTLQGRDSSVPLLDTSRNFLWTLPMVVVLILVTFQDASLTTVGVILAMLSGGLASGIGYAIWYSALRHISSTQAAVLQLAVPVIAALGGVVLMNESVTLTLVVAAVMILGGILLVLMARKFSVSN